MTKPSLTSQARAKLATYCGEKPSSPIAPAFADVVKVFDLVAGRSGEAAAFLASRGMNAGATLGKYWDLVRELPGDAAMKCGQASAALDTAFGVGKWRAFFSQPLENHPLLARVPLATALIDHASKVRASLGLAPAPTAQASASPMTPKLQVAAKASVPVMPGAVMVTRPAKPDFSHLHGIALARAAMEWQRTGKVSAWALPPPAPQLDALGRPITGAARTRAAFEQQTKAKQKK